MSRQVGPHDSEERNGAAIATIAVVGLLGLVVSALAIFRPPDLGSGGTTDVSYAQRPGASQTASQTAGASSSAAPDEQDVLPASVLMPRGIGKALGAGRVGAIGRELRRKTQLVLQEVGNAEFSVVDSLPDSDRGETGHGSSGGFGTADS